MQVNRAKKETPHCVSEMSTAQSGHCSASWHRFAQLKLHVFRQIVVNLSHVRFPCFKLQLRSLPKPRCKLQQEKTIYFVGPETSVEFLFLRGLSMCCTLTLCMTIFSYVSSFSLLESCSLAKTLVSTSTSTRTSLLRQPEMKSLNISMRQVYYRPPRADVTQCQK